MMTGGGTNVGKDTRAKELSKDEKEHKIDVVPASTAITSGSEAGCRTASAGQDVAKVEAASALSALADSAVVVANQRGGEEKSQKLKKPLVPTTPPINQSSSPPQPKQPYRMANAPHPAIQRQPQLPPQNQPSARPPPVHVLFTTAKTSAPPVVHPKAKVATKTSFEAIPLPYVAPEFAARRAAAARAYALASTPSTKTPSTKSRREKKKAKGTQNTVHAVSARFHSPGHNISFKPMCAQPVPPVRRAGSVVSASPSSMQPTTKQKSTVLPSAEANAKGKKLSPPWLTSSQRSQSMKSTLASDSAKQTLSRTAQQIHECRNGSTKSLDEKRQGFGSSPAANGSNHPPVLQEKNTGTTKRQEAAKSPHQDRDNLSWDPREDQGANETCDDIDDDDDEYSKFVRSLMSATGRPGNLSSDGGNGRFSQANSPVSLPPLQALPMAFTDDGMIGDDDDVSYQLQSDEDDDDVDADDGEGALEAAEGTSNEAASPPAKGAQKGQSHEYYESGAAVNNRKGVAISNPAVTDINPSPKVALESASVATSNASDALAQEDNDIAEWLVGMEGESPVALHDELVAELEALLEEDVQAAVTTLVREDGESSVSPSRVMSPSSELANFRPLRNNDGAKEQGQLPNPGASGLRSEVEKNFDSDGLDRRRELRRKTSMDNFTTVTSPVKRKLPPETPTNSSATACKSLPQISKKQRADLRSLMSLHYQLLIQQSILSVRALNLQRSTSSGDRKKGSPSFSKVGDKHGSPSSVDDVFGGETPDELADVLHSAVGMLQDLDDNRRDAIRSSMQLEASVNAERTPKRARRALFPPKGEAPLPAADDLNSSVVFDKRLTRSVFSRTLRERESGDHPGSSCRSQGRIPHQSPVAEVVGTSSFDVKGLSQLNETFAMIDGSVIGSRVRSQHLCRPVDESPTSVLDSETHTEACEGVFREARADYDPSFLPNKRDLSELLTERQEVYGPEVASPLPSEDKVNLRRNKAIFTSAEDNLLLKGVNLYGEKEWLLISNRYLPDRPVNAISQRYCHLCLLFYRANGVIIDESGNLQTPPDIKDVSEFDEEAISKLPAVKPPAKFDVHRWSLQEDITLLKAVPLMGHMWAEVSSRLIRHRHRGHLRKRYQVLERRVKATVKRDKKALLLGGSPVKERKYLISKRSGETMRASKTKICSSKPDNAALRSTPPNVSAEESRKAAEGTVPVTSTQASKGTGVAVDLHTYDSEMAPSTPCKEAVHPAREAKDVAASDSSLQTKRNAPVAQEKSAPDHVTSAFPRQNANQQGPAEERGRMFQAGFVQSRWRRGSESGAFTAVRDEHRVVSSTIQSPVDAEVSGEDCGSLPHPGKAFIAASIAGDTSHAAWEKIINNDNDNWSQLSRLQRLLDTTGSGSPVPTARDRSSSERNSGRSQVYQCLDGEKVVLPVMHIDTSSSGLSLLNNTRDGLGESTQETNADHQTSGESMMTKVMKRMKKTSQGQDRPVVGESTQETPSKSPTDVKHCGVEEELQTPRATADCSPSELLLRTNEKVNTFTPSTCAALSAPSTSLLCPDTGEMSTFSPAEQSRQGAESGSVSRLLQATLRSLEDSESEKAGAGGAHSLVATDLEAISALNSMSNSGFPGSNPTFPVPSPARKDESSSSCGDEPKPSGGCASFFSKVMEPLQAKTKKQ